MKLTKFDGKRVRVTTVWGDTIDGNCQHNSAEYNEHEFGRPEEGLQFSSLLLFRKDIKRIRLLKNGFPTPFGKLEEMAIEDGIDLIDEVLLSEDDEHILRLLRCLERYLDPEGGLEYPDREKTLKRLQEFHSETQNAEIKAEVERLLCFNKNQRS